jgi:hypothetical protein
VFVFVVVLVPVLVALEFRLGIGVVSWRIIEIERDERTAVACKAVVPLEYVEAVARVMLLRVVVYAMAVIFIGILVAPLYFFVQNYFFSNII